MAARHKHMKHKASGGKAEGIKNAGGNPYVEEEAEEKKRGGRAKHHMGKMHGGMSKHRLDRPGRKRGGRVGADMMPLSSASKKSSPDKEPREMVGSKSPD